MKNVVFDLGGVVVDWDPQRVMREYPGDPEMPVSLFKKGFFEKYWPDFDRGTVTQEGIVREMSRFANRPYAECWDFVEFVKHSLRDIPESITLMRELKEKGYKLYCLSNMATEFYDYLKDRKFFEYFDGQIISAIEKLIKPEKAIYQLLLDRYGLEAASSLYIDDLAKNIQAGQEMGFCTVHFVDKGKAYEEIKRKLEK